MSVSFNMPQRYKQEFTKLIQEQICVLGLSFDNTMDLSVIIVSYNVKYFLEQCLCSVKKAFQSLEIEVFVIDNNSSDGTLAYLQQKFPFVIFTGNMENAGFSKANNMALKKASGRYVLFLNPDTIVPEDCFTRTVSFMDKNLLAGALGVKMIDGGGRVLKESKRGFPSVWASFCKMTGLTKAFPSSKIFAAYYMGHLSENENQVVEALSGAFMMVRREVLDKTGGFDERFFMYAEDIDLSYRIQQVGYQNFYFSETTILHFKGESTRKDAQYVRLFYQAMVQFVQKHYNGFSSVLLVLVLNMLAGIKTLLYLFGSPYKENQQTSLKTPLNFAVIGDSDSIKEVSSFIPIKEGSENIIYCTGSNFSIIQMIEEIQTQSRKKNVFIHADNSHSIIGSRSKDRQGIILNGIVN